MNTPIRDVAFLHVGRNKRQHQRVWVEGQRLTAAGFSVGARYTLAYDQPQGTLHVTLLETGERKVSSRERNGRVLPIIELANSDVDATLGTQATSVRVVFRDGEVEVSIHHADLAARERLARLMGKLESGEPLVHGSLFTGAGVLDDALAAGLTMAAPSIQTSPAFVAELDPGYLEILLECNPSVAGAMSIEGSVAEIETRLLPRVELLVAGLPCTAVSRAGRAKKGKRWRDMAENRSTAVASLIEPEADVSAGSLFVALLRVVEACQPAICVIEQVVDFQNTAGAFVLADILRSWQYDVQTITLGGNDFGALENRQRLCMVAASKGVPFSWAGLEPVRTKEACLGDVLEPMADDDPRWRHYTYLLAKAERDQAEGKSFLMQLVTPESTSVPTVGRGYQKFRSTDPLIKSPVSDSLVRLLTPLEHMRVKAIPAGLIPIERLPLTTAHEMLGQSVVWPMFAAVGKHLGNVLGMLLRGEVPVVVQADWQPGLFGLGVG